MRLRRCLRQRAMRRMPRSMLRTDCAQAIPVPRRPTCRRRHFEARRHRRNLLPHRHSRLMRSRSQSRGIWLTMQMQPSRVRPFFRSHHCRIAPICRFFDPTRTCRAGISKFHLRPCRARRWRSSRFRATATVSASIHREKFGARASRSMSNRPDPCMRS